MHRLYKLLFILSAVLMVIALHRGRTDGNGGHYDHSTGEYHYHHGEGPHQHYDMDGDGKIDCPYEFKDKTDHSNNSSNNHTGNHAVSNNKKTKEDISFWDIVKAILTIIFSLLIIAFVGYFPILTIAYLIAELLERLLKLCLKKDLPNSTYNKILMVIFIIISILIVTITSVTVLIEQGLI